MCPQCRAFITTSDRTCPYCGEVVRAKAVDARSPVQVLGGFIPAARFTTIMILLVNFALFLASSFGAGAWLLNAGAKTEEIWTQGEWYRLVTAGFFHGGMLHIFMNSWVLYDLGAQVEEIYGTARLLVFYLVSSVAGFLLSAYLHPLRPSVGASAALFGFIGAMIALGVRNRTSVGQTIRSMYIRWAIYGLLFGLLPGIDNAAHVGGLAMGFVLAYFGGLPARDTATGVTVWRGAAMACVGIVAFSFFRMYLQFAASTH